MVTGFSPSPTTSADVIGPTSSTDEALIRFDGNGGKNLQDYSSKAPTASDDGIITLSAPIRWSKGGDLVAQATITPGADGNYFDITGATGITAIASLQAGTIVIFQFDSTPTLTHNGTTLILQGSTNFTVAAGDVVAFISEGSGNWRELFRRLAAAAGSGDVSGPASVNDNEIARYNGTGGKTIQGYTSGGPTISDTGVMTLTKQPSVYALNSASDVNKTGNNTKFTVIFDDEPTDQGGNFLTSTYTCPVGGAGPHLICASVGMDELDGLATLGELVIDSGNNNPTKTINPGVVRSVNNDYVMALAAIVDMDDSDTLTITIRVKNMSADTVDIGGSSTDPRTFLSIHKLA